MLGMMNCSTDNVEFYASPSSTRSVGDINAFTQAKKRPHVTYTNDGRKFVDGALVDGQTQLEPQKTWDLLVLNEVAKKQMKTDGSEIQRKKSTKKTVLSLRKFLPFYQTKSDLKSKTSKSDLSSKIPTQKVKSICQKKKPNECIVAVE